MSHFFFHRTFSFSFAFFIGCDAIIYTEVVGESED